MAEYNFWDDRTVEEHDGLWCPIANWYCQGKDCDKCELSQEFTTALQKEVNHETDDSKSTDR